jgi:hypothetical protein
MEEWERERRRKKKKQRLRRKNHGKACFDSDFRMFEFKGRGIVFIVCWSRGQVWTM